MAIYRSQKGRPLSEICSHQRLNNQVIISGTDEELIIPNGILCIEFVTTDSGDSITISDGDGNVIVSNLEEFSQDYVPLKCVGGMSYTGTAKMIKGFVLEDTNIL